MYYIIELQTTDQTHGNIVKTANDYNEAMSMYYAIMSAAAISSIKYHVCMVVDEHGLVHATNCYEHINDASE